MNENELKLVDGVEFAEDNTITSVDLVRIINVFREQENRKELIHGDFMKKIRKELKTLENAGISNQENIFSDKYIDQKGEERNCFKLTRDGVKLIADFTKNTDKIPMLKIYELMGGDTSKYYCVNRFEDSFFKHLQDVLTPMNINIELQKQCDNYRMDGYIEKYKLVIEYDEEHHKRQLDEDINREIYIKNKLHCDFIRLDYNNTDCYNIGLIMNKIISIRNK